MATLPRSWETKPGVESALGTLGTLAAFYLFAAPLCVPAAAWQAAGAGLRRVAFSARADARARRRTFRRIVTRRSTEEFSGVPYVVAAVQCFAWTVYCILTPGRLSPGVTNGIGVAVEGAYSAVFMRYVDAGPKRAAFARTLALACSCSVAATGFLLLGVPARRQAATVGLVADVLNVIMYSAPLGVMGTVVRTRSVEFMPFNLSLGTLGSAACWSAYAIYVGDATILVPNGMGVALALAQLALYARYAGTEESKAARARAAAEGGAQGGAAALEGALLLDAEGGEGEDGAQYSPPARVSAVET